MCMSLLRHRLNDLGQPVQYGRSPLAARLFEVDGVPEAIAREAMRLAANKLPISTKFIVRHKLA